MATKNDDRNEPKPTNDGNPANADTSGVSKLAGAGAAGATGPGTPNSPRASGTIGTGGPPASTLDVDPNIDIAREHARDVHTRKAGAGEKAGDAPPEPESLAAKASGEPSGPVPEGMKRVRVLSNISSGGRTYAAGTTADIPEGDVAALKGSVEAV